MMRSLSLATVADGGVLRNKASSPISASKHACKEPFLRLVEEAQWHGLSEQPRDGILVSKGDVTLLIQNDGHAGIGGGQHVGRLRHDSYDVQSQNLLDVINTHHLAGSDASRAVTGEQ